MPAAAHGPTVAVESNPAEMVGTALVAITPAVSQFVVFFGTLVFFLATNFDAAAEADRRRSSRATRGCA